MGSGKGATRKNANPTGSRAPNTPTVAVDFSDFDTHKLKLLNPFQTKYNTWAKFLYDGKPFLLRTPVFPRVFLHKFEDSHIRTGFSLGDGPTDKFRDGVLGGIENVIVEQLGEKKFKVPKQKRDREDDGEEPGPPEDEIHIDSEFRAYMEELRSLLKSLVTPGKDGFPPIFNSEILVDNPNVKRMEKLVPTNCKFFDHDMKLLAMKDVVDIIEDKDHIHPARALVSFSHVYMPTASSSNNTSSSTTRLGVKHSITGLQFMKGEDKGGTGTEDVAMSEQQIAEQFM